MARVLHDIEKGLRISKENSQTDFFDLIFGSAAPGGDAGEQDAAPIGSLYVRKNGSSSTIYQKVASSNAPSDWQENGSSSASIGVWRPEKVRAITSDTVTAGVSRNLSTTPFADDEGTQLAAADFQVGEYIIADSDGTPVLLEVTAISAPSVTFDTPVSAPALSAGDTFVTPNYLPDTPADQEGQAIANFNGSVMVKIGDIDWNFADGINLASGYAAASGDVSDADTVQSALQKIDGNNDAQDSLLGTAQGATNLSTFSGVTIPDSSTVKGALQSLETAYEETDANVDDLITLSGVAENAVDLGVFSGAIIPDSSTVKAALQSLETFAESEAADQDEIDQNVNDLITLSGVAENSTVLGAFSGFGAILLTATETIKSAIQKIADFLGHLRSVEVTGVTTAVSVDEVPVATYIACKWLVAAFEEATPGNVQAVEVYAVNDGSVADSTIYAKLKRGSNFNLVLSVDVSGGQMRLRAQSSTAGVTVRARRIGVVDI